MLVVMQTRIFINLLALHSQGLMQSLRITAVYLIAPRIKFGPPVGTTLCIYSRNRGDQMITVVQVNH